MEELINSCLILPAGGLGKRFGHELPKQFHLLAGKPLIILTIDAFIGISNIKIIIVPVQNDFKAYFAELLDEYNLTERVIVLEGGNERQDSVYNALKAKEAMDSDIILIHDAVRPFVSKGLINRLTSVAAEIGGAVPGLEPKETIRAIDRDMSYSTPDRKRLRSIQTPQVFRTKLIIEAYQKSYKDNFRATDDASLFEHCGFEYLIVEGEERNLKITTAMDFMLAETLQKVK